MDGFRLAVDCRCVRLRMSGVPRYIVNLLEHLIPLWREGDWEGAEVLALTSEEVHPRLSSIPGLRCVPVCRAPRFRWEEERLRFEQTVLPRILARLRVDLYHATWNHGVPLLSPVPAVLTVHDLMPLTTPEADPGSRLRRWSYRLSLRVSAHRARRVLAVSRATARDLRRHLHLPAHRIIVTPEAPEDRFHRPVPPERTSQVRQRYRLDAPYLIYVGGTDRRKNIGTLLRAVKWARERLGAGVRLALTTEPTRLPPPERALADSLGPGALRFLGYVPDEDLPALLVGSRGFVFASKAEGFGLPPLEAMACGVPVMVARSGSLPEVVGDGGVLIEPEDVPAWAKAMARAWRDEDWRSELSRRSRRRAQLFTWQRTAQITIQAYRRALGLA